MKKMLMISMITGTCLMLLKCKKDNNNNNTFQHSHYSYHLNLELKNESWPGGLFDWTLTDKASLDIDVIDSIVSISNIQNEDGLVTPAAQTFVGDLESCTSTWQQGESLPGYINITGGSGKTYGGGEGQNVMFSLEITSSKARIPKFIEVCTRSGTVAIGGDSLTTYNYFYAFSLDNETQTKTGTTDLTATLTPK